MKLLAVFAMRAAPWAPGDPSDLARSYAEALERLNTQHAASPRA